MADDLVSLVSAISDIVVAALAAANDAPLTDGKILVGSQHIAEQSSAPRVVFAPAGFKLSPRDVATPRTVQTIAESKATLQSRAIATETTRFEVYVWGQALPVGSDPDADRVATQRLYRAVIRALVLNVGFPNLTFSDGVWTDWTARGTKVMGAGWQVTFTVGIATPITDVAMELAPTGVTAKTQSSLTAQSGGGAETGCGG